MLAELIPAMFFEARGDLILWLLGAGGIALLVFGADRAVGSAARLAAALGMSKVIIGATIVSLGTTTPEAVVSVKAAFQGNPDLALGNGVGSIICDTALIFSLCCLLSRLPMDRFIMRRHGWLQLGAGVLLTATCLVLWAISGDIGNVRIPRVVGAAFLVLLVAYMALSVRWSRTHPGGIPPKAAAVVSAVGEGKGLRAGASLAILAAGLALVVGGSELLIGSVKELCERHSVNKGLVAATLVALGTSLPELATALASIAKGHKELLVGNIIGADILNVLFVIGASAAAVELQVHWIFFAFLLPVMLLALLLLRSYTLARGDTFRRWQGVPLLALYVVYLALFLVLKDYVRP